MGDKKTLLTHRFRNPHFIGTRRTFSLSRSHNKAVPIGHVYIVMFGFIFHDHVPHQTFSIHQSKVVCVGDRNERKTL